MIGGGIIYDSSRSLIVGFSPIPFTAINNKMPPDVVSFSLIGGTFIPGSTPGSIALPGSTGDYGGLNDLGWAVGAADVNGDVVPAAWDTTVDPVQTYTFQPLPGALNGTASAINNYGNIVGYCGNDAFYVARVGYPLVDLNSPIDDSSWQLNQAKDINDSGQITGWGTYNGQQTAFLLTPPPYRTISGSGVLGLLATAIFGGVQVGSSGFVIVGGIRIPVGPWGPDLGAVDSATRDALIGLVMDQLAKEISDPTFRASIRDAVLAGVSASVARLSQSATSARGTAP